MDGAHARASVLTLTQQPAVPREPATRREVASAPAEVELPRQDELDRGGALPPVPEWSASSHDESEAEMLALGDDTNSQAVAIDRPISEPLPQAGSSRGLVRGLLVAGVLAAGLGIVLVKFVGAPGNDESSRAATVPQGVRTASLTERTPGTDRQKPPGDDIDIEDVTPPPAPAVPVPVPEADGSFAAKPAGEAAPLGAAGEGEGAGNGASKPSEEPQSGEREDGLEADAAPESAAKEAAATKQSRSAKTRRRRSSRRRRAHRRRTSRAAVEPASTPAPTTPAPESPSDNEPPAVTDAPQAEADAEDPLAGLPSVSPDEPEPEMPAEVPEPEPVVPAAPESDGDATPNEEGIADEQPLQ